MNVYILFVLLIILIIVGVLLLKSIALDTSETQPPPIEEINKTVGGVASADKTKPLHIIDGLNYIYQNYLTANKNKSDEPDENLISNYPNQVYVWKAISDLRAKYKKDNIIFVIKNQDGYKLSVYDDNLYKKWAKSYKIGIVVCYDPSNLTGPHYIKGRDDKVVCELYEKYRVSGYNVDIISKDSYEDKAYFTSIPEFKKINYGNIPD